MKVFSFVFFVFIASIFSSCGNLVYQHPVPQKSAVLKEFPKELQGVYVNNGSDTLYIYKTNYQYGRIGSMRSLSGELSDKLTLKKYQDYYFLNFRNEDGFWNMIGARLIDGKLKLYLIELENKGDIRIVNSILKKDKIKSTRNNDLYVMNPEGDELIEMFANSQICETNELIVVAVE